MTSEELISDPIGRYPPATVACFDPTTGELPRRRLDTKKTIRFLERLAAAEAPAVLIAASTGHGHLRTVDELEDWFSCSAEATLGDTVKMALLRPEDGLAANTRLVSVLDDLGYSVVFVRPGTDLDSDATDEQVAENMQPVVRVAAELGLAVGVYSITDVSGLRLSADATVMLLDGPGGDHIVAAKLTEANYESSTLYFLDHPRLKHLKIVQGWDPYLARALQDGPCYDERQRQRSGVTSGPMSLAVFQYQHILAATDAEDWNEAAMAQQAVTTLFESMQDDPARFADLQRAKYIMGLGHPLQAAITEAQVERVFAVLEALPRAQDRQRLAASLDLMGSGPYHVRLQDLAS